MYNRRSLLIGSVAVAALPLANCATTGLLNPSVVEFIKNAVATAAKYIPTVESIAATAASLFGPAYVAVVQIGSAALDQVIATLVNVVNSLPLSAKRNMRASLRGSSPMAPVVIGRTPSGVTVTGYRL